MFEMTGENYDVQEIVETPSVYIFGRAQDSIAEKLAYVDTRLEDAKDLSIPLDINGTIVHDTLRFFHGKSVFN